MYVQIHHCTCLSTYLLKTYLPIYVPHNPGLFPRHGLRYEPHQCLSPRAHYAVRQQVFRGLARSRRHDYRLFTVLFPVSHA